MLLSRIARCRIRWVWTLVGLAAAWLCFAALAGPAHAQDDITQELEELFGLTEEPPPEPEPDEPEPAEPESEEPFPEAPAPAPEPELPDEPDTDIEAEAAATGYGAAGLPVEVASPRLQNSWRMMVHYFKVVRFDLARQYAERVLAANPDPTVVLALVESPSTGYDLMVKMLRREEMGDAPSRLLNVADEGRRLKRTDAARIRRNLERLDEGPRAYYHALKDLKYSGPYVVPHALAVLSDPAQEELHLDVRRALGDIGRPAVLPLLAALETPDPRLRKTIIEVLGNIGYHWAVPALKAIVEDPASSEGHKDAATDAIIKIADRTLLARPADQLYLDLAERYYYGRIIVADERAPTTDLFEWVKDVGLLYKPVPSVAVNEALAARACADALRTDPSALESVALWASAMIQMESDLEDTETPTARQANPFLPENMPTVDFFIRAIGQQHLYRVLDRALRDQNVPVAVRACQALESVANEQFLMLYGEGTVGSPLVTALTYPDQRLRYAAAFALAAIRPTNPFTGAGRVVPVLGEALSLEATKAILLVEPEPDNRNRMQAALDEEGWDVVAVTTGNEGLERAAKMPRVDAVVLSSRTTNVDYGQVISLLRRDHQSAMTPIVVLSWQDDPIPSDQLKADFKYIQTVDPAIGVEELLEAVDQLKRTAGAMILTDEAARETSLKAARVLQEVAVGSRIYSARKARAALLQALTDRPDEVVVAVLGALAEIADPEITRAMAAIGTDEERSDTVRVAALESLSRAARLIGNHLRPQQVAAVRSLAGSPNDQLRDAAGQALGGLDLDAAGAARLVLEFGTPHGPPAEGE